MAVALATVVGCKGESVTEGDETHCGQLSGKLISCDMGVLLRDLDCEEPDDDETRCIFECVLDASCAEIRTLVCSEDTSSALEACISGCQPGPFVCRNGETVPDYATCDGYPDCFDGSDETADCPTCGNGETYPKYSRCDGYADCVDGADENRCPVFTCSNGATVPESAECDYFADCADGSDEHARCPGFACASGGRVPESFECDGERDCTDGSDEHARCPHVTCADGTTVPGARCDDSPDCPDYSDEPADCPPSAEEQLCGAR